MLSIQRIREQPDVIKADLEKRGLKEKILLLIQLQKKDEQWKKMHYDLDLLKKEKNLTSQEIGKLKKAGKDAKAAVSKGQELGKKVEMLTLKKEKLYEEILTGLAQLPNVMHPDVPKGKNDKDNPTIKEWGKQTTFSFDVKNHIELGEALGMLDFDTSAETTGTGFYFLKGDLALLNQAIIHFAIGEMVKRGYQYIEPPLMIKESVLKGVYSKEDISHMSYKIEGEDLFLIATSEHPLIGMFVGKTINPSELPLKITGYSMCFRKEIGSHGIDEKGLFRTHQFNKVEQIIVCKPEESYAFYDELLENSEKLFQALKIPYRVVDICSGDMGHIKHRSCDLEVWMPHQKEYREACSLTNCTDYQARALNIKVGITGSGEKIVPHTLNNTAIATSRALVAIMENFQNKDGSITIPSVLVPYMYGIKKIEKKN